MTRNRVIVFGPTGNVASITAKSAQRKDAEVFLAMRDITKPIPGLTAKEEALGGFRRVRADLTSAQSVYEAVSVCQADSAFLYYVHGSPDHMEAALKALKSAGVTFIVFLSSYTVQGQPQSVSKDDLIPWVHAQVEIQLEKIFGPEKYVAIRPGGFATNTLSWKWQLKTGELRIQAPNAKFDYVTPADMGSVSGTILASGQQHQKEKIVYLFGPQLLSQAEAAKAIAATLQTRVAITPMTIDESVQEMEKRGVPPTVARCSAALLATDNSDGGIWKGRDFRIGQENIRKYTNRAPMGFGEWVEASAALFTG